VLPPLTLYTNSACAISIRILEKKRSYTSQDRNLEQIQTPDVGDWAEIFETKLRFAKLIIEAL
jgi:hypothetical protein